MAFNERKIVADSQNNNSAKMALIIVSVLLAASLTWGFSSSYIHSDVAHNASEIAHNTERIKDISAKYEALMETLNLLIIQNAELTTKMGTLATQIERNNK